MKHSMVLEVLMLRVECARDTPWFISFFFPQKTTRKKQALEFFKQKVYITLEKTFNLPLKLGLYSFSEEKIVS